MKILRYLSVAALALTASAAFGQVKISNLPAASALGGTEPTPMVQAGATVRATPAQISTYTFSQMTASTVTGKFTGTCNISSFLRGDGQCSAVSLTAAVSGLLPVANGGTGQGSLSTDNLFMGNGTGAMSAKAIPSCSGANNALTYNTGTGVWGCNAIASSGAPGGSSSNIQYNSSSTFAGSADFTYNGTSTVTLGNSTNGTIIGGAPATATSTGRTLTLQGGPGGATSGTGGQLTLNGGAPVAGASAGGNIVANAGNGIGGGNGGVFVANGGNAQLGGTGGTISIAGGSSVTGLGGTVSITSGTAGGANTGAALSLIGGVGGQTGIGAPINITSGAGGTTSGASGSISLLTGTPVDGNSGSISISTPNAVGTNRTAGNVTLSVGGGTGAGVAGAIQFQHNGTIRLRVNNIGEVQMNSILLDQAQNVSTPTTGFNINVGLLDSGVIITPAGTLASGTVTLPAVASVTSGRIFCMTSSQTVTSLTVAGNGATVNGAPTTITASTPFCLIYNGTAAAWFRRS